MKVAWRTRSYQVLRDFYAVMVPRMPFESAPKAEITISLAKKVETVPSPVLIGSRLQTR